MNQMKRMKTDDPESKLTTSKNNHEAQWERQGEWLEKLRAHKKMLVEEQGMQGWELWEAMASVSLDHKVATLQGRGNRCEQCWHDLQYCLCARLGDPIPAKFLEGSIGIKLCVLMHHKEYLGAGNSAKLLLRLMTENSELYLYGKTGEFDRLLDELASCEREDVMILWPGADALSVGNFMKKSEHHQQEMKKRTVRAIVLDGTYSQARNMYKCLRKRMVSAGITSIDTVAVNPNNLSVFHRAQKNYGKAHQQQQATTRISTAEACGYLLVDLGVDPSVLERITDAVLLNNQALNYARTLDK